MKFKITKTLLALSLSTLVSTSVAAPYKVVDLGGLDGNQSVAHDINEAGIAVGYASGPLDEDGRRTFAAHATQFDSAGNVDLGVLPEGTVSESTGINEAMVSVGYSNVVSEEPIGDDGDTRTVSENFAVFFEGGSVSKLPPLENVSKTQAYDINNSDVIILKGSFDIEPGDGVSPVDRAFVYDRVSSTYSEILPFADSDGSSYATSLNDNGDIVGYSSAVIDESTNTVKSYITNAADTSQLIEIPTIDNRAIFARSINSGKKVVGSIYISGTRDLREAFVVDMSDPEPQLKLLGFFEPGFTDSRANDINNMGQIVGRAFISVPTLGESGAFLYESDEMKNLNNLIACDSPWTLTEARAINDSGQIVGIGVKNGEVRAFRLDPTGEPVEDCGDTNQSNDGGGSFPVLLVAVLAALGLRRKLR